ncbi:MAG TPA: hypothetical protein VNE16_02255 [Vicinamibacterales bacterium]|nr:hypothetical protein [Vicinamibacterales bacterium]
MYTLVLALHSLIRWAVLGFGILAAVRGLLGWARRAPWTGTDERVSFWAVMSMDLQALLGILLYAVLSPLTAAAFHNWSFAMRDAGLRFWAVEHVTMMIAALALLHIARVRIRRTADPVAKHRTAAVLISLSMILVLAGIPWPGLAYGRPLLRMF